MHVIHLNPISLGDLGTVWNSKEPIMLSKEAQQAIERCRAYLDGRMETQETPIYGVNTGFGSLCNTKIENDSLGQLQENLVKSHACGTGEEVPREVVELMLLIKIRGLSFGHSGVQLETVQRLIDFYNEGVCPIIFQQGSLGASGDLAPLAHLSLPLLGLGEVELSSGERISGSKLETRFGWKPIKLKSKEGLALLNGTQFMSAYGCFTLLRSRAMLASLEGIAALSLDAYDGRIEPFSDLPHLARKQPGQLKVARKMRDWLEGSELIEQEKAHVQDPYSFRCIPQVHGASYDAIDYVTGVFENEINSVTDNPTVFPDDDEIISAGNFHGQPLAMSMDFLAIALAELGSISERRVYKLISGTRNLPPFLVANPGLNSGFMIPQYTAASIVSQNKQLCSPASIDTIDSSNGQEDHVSMGANAATKLFRILENLEQLFAIELVVAAQALEFRRPLKSSEKVEQLLNKTRKSIPMVQDDMELHILLKEAKQLIKKL